MSMKKFTKKMLAIVAAGAMTMGLAMPTSVFAAKGDTTTKVTKAYISKTFNTEVGKDETFSFKATPVAGNTNEVTIPDITFTADKTGSTTKRTQVSFPTNWTDAGKYEYTVKETAATPAITNEEHQKMIMSQAEYTMDVYVSNGDNGFEISNIIVNKKKDDKGEVAEGKVDISDTDDNRFNFTNTYVQEAGTGTDPINPDPTYTDDGSLKVTKAINANGGTVDAEKKFDFTATFIFPTGTDASTLRAKATIESTATDITGTSYTFKLKHNQNVKFTGLPVGTKISVTESATPNYKGSAERTFNGVAQTKIEATKYDEAITVTNTLGQKQNKVAVTNTYNYVPTTGIIMNTLPYVLMVVLCAAALFGFVAFKRKKVQK